ncbi:MAG: nitrilase-related carbon-nitrogen hydrolase [Bacillota bacterium]
MALDGWKEKLFQRYLLWQCRPARLQKYLKSVLPKPEQPGPVDRKKIRVAALQVEFKLFKSPFAYIDEIHRRVREAREAGAVLVVFPEYNNLPLLGMLPGIEKLGEAKEEEKTGTAAEKNEEAEPGLAEVFAFMSPITASFVHTVFSSLASAYGLHIMAGSYALLDKGNLVNRSFLYNAKGELAGSQDKVHLLPVEYEWNLKRGTQVFVIDTTLGKLALPVCMDATYYETFRLLELQGVEIVLLPIANLESYNYWLALRGIWPRVQESPLYGIKSALVGSLAGFTFTGRAGIFAPIELTANHDGVLAEVEPYDREAMAVADLDLEALVKLRRDHPWRDFNPNLYRRYFPGIYREIQKDGK